MAYTLMSTDVENVSNLSDLPNESDGLTAAELKAVFDQAGVDIKDFINNTLIPELDVGAAKSLTVTFPSGETSYTLESSSYGFNSDSIVFAQPAEGYTSLWNSCGIKCSAVDDDELSFTADTAPDSDVSIQVVVMN